MPTCLHFPSQNPPKSLQKPILKGINFWSILASIFSRFLLDLGGQLGAMLATFSSKMGGPCGTPPPFLLGLCYFSIFWSSWPPLGPIWARFWKVWASILEVFGVHFGGFWSRFGCHVACNFDTFLSCSFLKLPLVWGGLVGLREALTILKVKIVKLARNPSHPIEFTSKPHLRY